MSDTHSPGTYSAGTLNADTLIVDLDGPILDGKGRHYACYCRILAQHGYSPIPIDAYWDLKRSRGDRRTLLALSGAQSLYATFLAEWLDSIESDEMLVLDRVQPGAAEQLARWQGQGIRLILATMRRDSAALQRQLAALRLLPLFARVVICDHAEGGAGKAQRILAAEGAIDGARCLWIGDTEADVEGARRLGARVVAVTCGLRTAGYLASLQPDDLVDNLSRIEIEVPHATQ